MNFASFGHDCIGAPQRKLPNFQLRSPSGTWSPKVRIGFFSEKKKNTSRAGSQVYAKTWKLVDTRLTGKRKDVRSRISPDTEKLQINEQEMKERFFLLVGSEEVGSLCGVAETWNVHIFCLFCFVCWHVISDHTDTLFLLLFWQCISILTPTGLRQTQSAHNCSVHQLVASIIWSNSKRLRH